MSSGTTRWSFLLAVALVLAACGASAATPAATDDGTAGTTATAEPAAGATDDSTGGSTGGGGGSSFAGNACDLLTTGEVEAATQQPSITASEVAKSETDGVAACAYLLQAQVPITILTVLNSENTSLDPGTYLSLPGSATVDTGSGAKGVWVPTIGVMFVFKNGVAVSLQVVAPAPGEEIVQTATKLAKAVAGRLP